jgi:hypothetical protein
MTVILKLTWHTQHDDRVCPICQAIDGYVWTIESGKDVFYNTLTHPTYGDVWNVQEGSRAHGHQNDNCRCRITPEFDLSDLVDKTQKLYNAVKAGDKNEFSGNTADI